MQTKQTVFDIDYNTQVVLVLEDLGLDLCEFAHFNDENLDSVVKVSGVASRTL